MGTLKGYPGHGAEWDIEEVKRLLSREEWEDDPDNDMQVRRLFLGTIFGLTPSGKFYAPFACSNVWGCASCKGQGAVLTVKRRVMKRRQAKYLRQHARHYMARNRPVFVHRERRDARHEQWRRIYDNANKSTCPCTACGGMGSREAYLDERWGEYSEALFEAHGIAIECSDGDYFACDYRDKPEEEEEDEDGDDGSDEHGSEATA